MVQTANTSSRKGGKSKGKDVKFSPGTDINDESIIVVSDQPVHIFGRLPSGHTVSVYRVYDGDDDCADVPDTPVMCKDGCSPLMLFNVPNPECESGASVQDDIWVFYQGRYKLRYSSPDGDTVIPDDVYVWCKGDTLVSKMGINLPLCGENGCPPKCVSSSTILMPSDTPPVYPPSCYSCESPVAIFTDLEVTPPVMLLHFWSKQAGAKCSDDGEWVTLNLADLIPEPDPDTDISAFTYDDDRKALVITEDEIEKLVYLDVTNGLNLTSTSNEDGESQVVIEGPYMQAKPQGGLVVTGTGLEEDPYLFSVACGNIPTVTLDEIQEGPTFRLLCVNKVFSKAPLEEPFEYCAFLDTLQTGPDINTGGTDTFAVPSLATSAGTDAYGQVYTVDDKIVTYPGGLVVAYPDRDTDTVGVPVVATAAGTDVYGETYVVGDRILVFPEGVVKLPVANRRSSMSVVKVLNQSQVPNLFVLTTYDPAPNWDDDNYWNATNNSIVLPSFTTLNSRFRLSGTLGANSNAVDKYADFQARLYKNDIFFALLHHLEAAENTAIVTLDYDQSFNHHFNNCQPGDEFTIKTQVKNSEGEFFDVGISDGVGGAQFNIDYLGGD